MGFVFLFILWFAVAIALTVAIEYGMLRLMGESRRHILRASVIMNVLTNLTLNLTLLVFVVCDSGSLLRGELIGEVAVVVVEALWYALLLKNIWQACVYSMLCNAVSYLCGFFLQLLMRYIV